MHACTRVRFHVFVALLLSAGLTPLAAQAEKGIAIDSPSGKAYVFDTATNSIVSVIQATAPGTTTSLNDCEISQDNSKGYVTSTNSVTVLDLPQARVNTTIPLAYSPIDLVLTPSSRYLMTTGNTETTPVNAIDTTTLRITSSLLPPAGTYYGSSGLKWIDACDNQTLIGGFGTSYFDDTALHRLSLSPSGQLRSTLVSGPRVGYGGNGHCAPGGKTAGVMQSASGFASVVVAAMAVIPENQRFGYNGRTQSGGFSVDGQQLLIRSNYGVSAYSYNPATGQIGLEPLWYRDASVYDVYAQYFGTDFLAVSRDTGNVYYSDASTIRVVKPGDGSLVASIVTPATNLTGVCLRK